MEVVMEVHIVDSKLEVIAWRLNIDKHFFSTVPLQIMSEKWSSVGDFVGVYLY